MPGVNHDLSTPWRCDRCGVWFGDEYYGVTCQEAHLCKRCFADGWEPLFERPVIDPARVVDAVMGLWRASGNSGSRIPPEMAGGFLEALAR